MPPHFTRLLMKLGLVIASGFGMAFTFASGTSASRPQLGHYVYTFSIPGKVSQSDLDRVLRFVADNRRWVLVAQDEGCTELSLDHRGISSHVYFYREGSSLVMRHLSSDAKGAPTSPDRWFRNLRKDIEAQLASKQ